MLSALSGRAEPFPESAGLASITPPAGVAGPVTGNFEGYLDIVNCNNMTGWVWNRDKGNTSYAVEFLSGSTLESASVAATVQADLFRQDLKDKGKGNGLHGYTLAFPEALKTNQAQTIWARIQGSTFVLKGAPKTVTCQGNATPAAKPQPTTETPAPAAPTPATTTQAAATTTAAQTTTTQTVVATPTVTAASSSTVSFSFNLGAEARTSAGVFKKDGTLVRTLWGGITYKAGTYTETWDGKDDEGRLLLDGNYDIKVLSNNVTYTWEGTIGNNAANTTGIGKHRGWNPVSGMVIVGDKAYFCSAYQEGNFPLNWFSLSKPGVNNPIQNFKGDNGITHVASDGANVYWSNDDPYSNKNFVFATKVANDAPVTFSEGVSAANAHGPTYTSSIDFNNNSNGFITGLAVQKTGKFLFVAHRALNEIHVLDKTTGKVLKNITNINNPKKVAVEGDFLWVISETNAVKKYPVNPDGSLGNPVVSLSGLENPIAFGISPDLSTITVADAGNSQQVKSYSTKNGAQSWVLGQAGGYMTSSTVTNDKFFFTSLVSDYNYTYICYQPDGSFWVGDSQNRRSMRFSSARKYLDEIMYLPRPYTAGSDPNDPSRVFQGYLEFKVDYSKPLAPNNGSWKLVANWGYVPANYNDHYEMTNVVTLSNGRTYCRQRNTTNTKGEIFELVPNGILRQTSTTGITLGYQMAPDGSMYRLIKTNGVQQWGKRTLTGFDTKNNPIYTAEKIIQSTDETDGSNPDYDGVYTSPNAISSSGIYISFDGDGSNTNKFHLGGIKAGEKTWKWKAAYSTHPEYEGVFPPDGRFDVGNGMGPDHKYAGSVAVTLDRNIIWGYHGEFWKNSQTNKWNHFYDNGLFVGQFGTTRPQTNGSIAAAEMAGNSFYASLIRLPDGRVFLYHGEENDHSGLHRWKVDGLNTIREQTIPVTFTTQKGGLAAYYFESEDLNNMTLKTSRLDAQVNFNWATAAPTGTTLSPTVAYSVLWKGYVKPNHSEEYTFYLNTASGVRVWIDNKLAIDKWNNSSNNELTSSPIAMENGRQYAIRIESKGSSTINLSWSSNNQPKAVIPGEALSPETDKQDMVSTDLLYGLPFNKVLENNIYGWKRSPEKDILSNQYSNWWEVETSRLTYRRESPDLFIKFRQASGVFYVTRDLGAVKDAANWSLTGRISYKGNEGNEISGKGGNYLEILDKNGKTIAVTFVTIDYNGRIMGVFGNTAKLLEAQQDKMRPIIDQPQPLQITATASGVTFKYAHSATVTTKIFDPTADWRSPKTMRLSFFCEGRNADRIIDIESMRFSFTRGTARKAADEPVDAERTGQKMTVYPNPSSSVLNVQHSEAVEGGTLSIFSIEGRKMGSVSLQTGSSKTIVDVSALPVGKYVLRLDSGRVANMARFIKQ